MKKLVFLFISTVALLNGYSQSTGEKLDQYLQAANQYAGFNGCALVAKDGKILLEKGYGLRNAATQTPHDANSIFQIGSVTKQFTATLILKLQQQGKLNVTDKLSKYFPEYQYADKISIENLLTHTSGIDNYTNDTDYMKNHVTETLPQQTFWNMIKDKPLDFEPGEKFNYSNSGFVILGYIIEKVSGMPYTTFARQEIFAPANMSHSGFDFTHLQSPEKSTGYFELSKTQATPSPIVNSTVAFSAGAIYSTVHDLYNWNVALNSQQIIPEKYVTMQYKPHLNKYGYGVFIDSIFGRQAISHGGGIHGFTSMLYYLPADKVSVVVLTNNSGDAQKPAKDMLAILYDKPYTVPTEVKEIQLDSATLKKYVGSYELSPAFSINVFYENGALKAQATGQPSFELFAKDKNIFFLKVVDAQVEFLFDADGNVASMILHQNGQNIPGKKVK